LNEEKQSAQDASILGLNTDCARGGEKEKTTTPARPKFSWCWQHPMHFSAASAGVAFRTSGRHPRRITAGSSRQLRACMLALVADEPCPGTS